ncbi:hypothetical protein ACIBL6_06835 [Streptomyces sp. NPDC050400]|uniref:hypothetical protein n=1 Tax=Streptomyces sp. NPDC050400 TaxID=3365610 RepID=UPI00378948D7
MTISIGIALTLSGCGNKPDGHRDFATPSTLCGVEFDTSELVKFLPSGKNLSTKEEHPGKGITQCRVLIDDKLAASATQAWQAEGSTLTEFSAGQTLKKIDHAADGGKYVFSGSEAFGSADNCTNPEQANRRLFTAVQATDSKHDDSDAMKSLIESYTSAVEHSNACR